MRRRAAIVGVVAVVLGLAPVAAAQAYDHDTDDRGVGQMGARTAATTAVDPASGEDFELPFLCGQVWEADTRATHSPNAYTLDFNRVPDRGQPALAVAPGVVSKVVTLTSSYGRYVVIDHGGGFSSLYAHLDAFNTTVGAYVDQGEKIGVVGASGGVTGPHLHFEERLNGAYFREYAHRTPIPYGVGSTSSNCNDRPITGDWDGDGRTDVGVYRNVPTYGEFHLLTGSTESTLQFGGTSDNPLTGNFAGDARSEVMVRHQGTAWWSERKADGTWTTISWGYPSDVPVTGDWDGDGHDDIGVYRPGAHTFYLRYPNGWYDTIPWGRDGSAPVTGDWNGDGKTDVGTFDPLTGAWSLRVPKGSSYTTTTFSYGQTYYYGQRLGDLPVTGDWDGDGKTEVGVWRSSTGTFWRRMADGSSTAIVYGTPRG